MKLAWPFPSSWITIFASSPSRMTIFGPFSPIVSNTFLADWSPRELIDTTLSRSRDSRNPFAIGRPSESATALPFTPTSCRSNASRIATIRDSAVSPWDGRPFLRIGALICGLLLRLS